MGLDAYLAIGRLPGGIAQHVWVVTRESNGDVRLWETTKGRYYTLPQRWKGSPGASTSPALAQALAQALPKPYPSPSPKPKPKP